MGLPCQRVDGGTSSPRITSEAGPTVAPPTRSGPAVVFEQAKGYDAILQNIAGLYRFLREAAIAKTEAWRTMCSNERAGRV